MADERAKQDELSFKKAERQFLKLILRICEYEGKITSLKNSDIDIKFTRNKSDNLLVKTQGLLNMKEAQVSPDIAFTICGLFSDPNDVYAKAKKYFGDNFWKSESKEVNNSFNASGNQNNNQNNNSKQKNNPASGVNN